MPSSYYIGLTDEDLNQIHRHLPGLAGKWSLAHSDDLIESVTLLADFAGDPSKAFLLEQTVEGVRLVSRQWDVMHTVGLYRNISSAMDVAAVLSRASPQFA